MCVATKTSSGHWRTDELFGGSQALHRLETEAGYATDLRPATTRCSMPISPVQATWCQPETSYQPGPSVMVSSPHHHGRDPRPTPLRRSRICSQNTRTMRNPTLPQQPCLVLVAIPAWRAEIQYMHIADPHRPRGIQPATNATTDEKTTHQFLDDLHSHIPPTHNPPAGA